MPTQTGSIDFKSTKGFQSYASGQYATLAQVKGQFATCSTAAATQAKAATIVPSDTGWELYTGATITVKFTTDNTHATPTLNVNSTGAKSVRDHAGAALTEEAYKWKAGDALAFTYDGTYWRMQDTLAQRVTTNKTAIEQNASDIKLAATKEEVEKTYSTKDDSQLDRAGSGTSVTVEGAANAALKGLHVLGESVQDGTPTPSAPVPIVSVSGNLLGPLTAKSGTAGGVSYTISEDGTFTMSGTATGASYFTPVTGKTLPAGTYTLSVSNRSNYTEKSFPPEVKFGDASTVSTTLTRTFTSEWDISLCKVYVRNAQTYNSSFSVQLYVGHAAWIDSGHDGIGLRVVGKNLLPPYSALTLNGISCSVANDGVVTLNGTATATANFQSYFLVPKTDTYTLSGCPSGGGASSIQLWTYDMTTWETIDGQITDVGSGGTRTLTRGHWIVVRLRVQNGYTCNNVVVRPQLELGSEATEYEPYSGSVTTIPLNGHELRSLPDGTRDELTVDTDGHVTMTQRVGSVENVGNKISAAVTVYTVNGLKCVPYTPDNYSASSRPSALAAMITTGTVKSSSQVTTGDIYMNPANIMFMGDADDTAADIRTLYANATLTYPLATPQTIDLGTIDMPQVKDGDTVEVIAALTPSTDVTWWASAGQAVADAYASLSSAIEVRAESIVSTVSERYATSQEVRDISSQITQTAQGWTAQFNELTGGADLSMTLAQAFETLGVTSDNLEEIRSFVRITTDSAGDPVLLMGSATSPNMLALSNDSLRFMHGSDPVAYIDVDGETNEGELHITRATIDNELRFGSKELGSVWRWHVRANGNLALGWTSGAGDE